MKHTIKHKSLLKNSFSLLETIISITLLAIIISGFANSTYYDKTQAQNFDDLNKIENLFDTNEYKKLSSYNKTLNITKNSTPKTVQVKVYEYKNENIKVVRYEK